MAQAKSIQHAVNVGNDNSDQVQQFQSNSGHTARRTSENHSATMSIGELLNPSGYMIASSDEDKPITRPANPDENTFKQEDLHMNSGAQSSVARDKAVQRRGHSCTIKMCPNKAVSKGRCISHGGGCRCKIVGCKNGAKMYGLCHLHGGRKKCKFTGCGKFAKSLGLCWAHGGSKICSQDGCEKGALKGGFCWAHGGGKRCCVANCQKPVKTGDTCAVHCDASGL
ncbi:hypothetical protein Ae201684_008711 [Aphanomyces euteiches]|uniref:WRKY19-like zinc finger domain-containing protein n=1 Tax=Aphanomyces euteiches TaxID=100861 RepID=A0A6G0X4B4_9STRA|nr:hypothetical protein Ae201684_008711 [Aphanomyces euteiches]